MLVAVESEPVEAEAVVETPVEAPVEEAAPAEETVVAEEAVPEKKKGFFGRLFGKK